MFEDDFFLDILRNLNKAYVIPGMAFEPSRLNAVYH